MSAFNSTVQISSTVCYAWGSPQQCSIRAEANHRLEVLQEMLGDGAWKRWMIDASAALRREEAVQPMTQEDKNAWWILRAGLEIAYRSKAPGAAAAKTES